MKNLTVSLCAFCTAALVAPAFACGGGFGFHSGSYGYHNAGVAFLATPYVPTVAVAAVQPAYSVAAVPAVKTVAVDPVAAPVAVQPVAAVPVAPAVVTPTYATTFFAATPSYTTFGHGHGYSTGFAAVGHGRFHSAHATFHNSFRGGNVRVATRGNAGAVSVKAGGVAASGRAVKVNVSRRGRVRVRAR